MPRVAHGVLLCQRPMIPAEANSPSASPITLDMATNPIDPNYSRRPEPEFRDPDLKPVGKSKGPLPWGLIAAVITILCVIGIIWYFR